MCIVVRTLFVNRTIFFNIYEVWSRKYGCYKSNHISQHEFRLRFSYQLEKTKTHIND